MKACWLILGVIVSLSCVSVASAKGKPKGPGAVIGAAFGKLDVNKDKKVSREELRAKLVRNFKQFDLNKDGTATVAEEREARQKRKRDKKARRFAKRDVNKDGRLTKTESRMSNKKFTRLDTNKDGSLTLAEACVPKQKKQQKAKTGPSKKFRRLDANSDGKITEAEARGVADALMRHVDKNKDGYITWPETGVRPKGKSAVKSKGK